MEKDINEPIKSMLDRAYNQALDDLSDLIDRLLWEYDTETYNDLSMCFKESVKKLKK